MKIEELEMDRCDYHKINMGNMRHAEGLEQRSVLMTEIHLCQINIISGVIACQIIEPDWS